MDEIIADRGFFSSENIAAMEAEKLHYIIPFHRNNTLIDFEPLKRAAFKKEPHYFIFQERIIWYYAYESCRSFLQKTLLSNRRQFCQIKIRNVWHRSEMIAKMIALFKKIKLVLL